MDFAHRDPKDNDKETDLIYEGIATFFAKIFAAL